MWIFYFLFVVIGIAGSMEKMGVFRHPQTSDMMTKR